jgi:hypothetical protein
MKRGKSVIAILLDKDNKEMVFDSIVEAATFFEVHKSNVSNVLKSMKIKSVPYLNSRMGKITFRYLF